MLDSMEKLPGNPVDGTTGRAAEKNGTDPSQWSLKHLVRERDKIIQTLKEDELLKHEKAQALYRIRDEYTLLVHEFGTETNNYNVTVEQYVKLKQQNEDMQKRFADAHTRRSDSKSRQETQQKLLDNAKATLTALDNQFVQLLKEMHTQAPDVNKNILNNYILQKRTLTKEENRFSELTQKQNWYLAQLKRIQKSCPTKDDSVRNAHPDPVVGKTKVDKGKDQCRSNSEVPMSTDTSTPKHMNEPIEGVVNTKRVNKTVVRRRQSRDLNALKHDTKQQAVRFPPVNDKSRTSLITLVDAVEQ